MQYSSLLGLTAITAALALQPRGAAAQEGAAPEQLYMSRTELASLLDFYEQSAASPAYSERLQARAEVQGEIVRARLEEGDFRVGDRIVVVLESPGIASSDTFLVQEGNVVRFPDLGEVDLTGVLRSELGGELEQFLGRYLREPRFQSTSLVRIQLAGAVSRPGFYTMPSETPLPDAIMLAGGPVGDVDLSGIRIERRGSRILTGDRVQDALADGRTLDQVGLQGGDRIVVPPSFPLGRAEGALRTLGYILALPLAIAGIIALFS
jgi:protein involved in polysaccharide export with SLBB domain